MGQRDDSWTDCPQPPKPSTCRGRTRCWLWGEGLCGDEEANYVFPGGRFRLDDLPMERQTAESLRLVHCSNSTLALAALPKTLARELGEELGMVAGQDYVASERRVIGPYRMVEGASNRRAYTEYRLVLHDIRLTSQGEARVLERAAGESNRLAWFSVEDILAPAGRPDGKRAFIDALREQLGYSEDAMKKGIKEMLDSKTRPFGLRKFVRMVASRYRIAVPKAE